MWIAVVPACNEALSISTVINTIFQTQINLLLLIANGCTDQTCQEALQAAKGRPMKILFFPQALGIDVPKAVGAAYALKYKPQGIIFVDGDMKGSLHPVLLDLINAVENGLDLALTNCYPFIQQRSDLANQVLQAREALNRRLGLIDKLGVSTPSHGPHAFSSALLQNINLASLAIPPKALAQAALSQAQIGVGAVIPHNLLGSEQRSPLHSEKIAETIIGDCQEALELLDPPFPCSSGLDIKQIGYRNDRRFDILDRILENCATNKIKN